MTEGKHKPTPEQEKAIEKAREKINKASVKKAERGYEKWRLSGARTH